MKSFLTSLFWSIVTIFIIVTFITWDLTTLAHEDNSNARCAFLFFSILFAVFAEIAKHEKE